MKHFSNLNFDKKLFEIPNHYVIDEKVAIRTFSGNEGFLAVDGKLVANIKFSQDTRPFFEHKSNGRRVYQEKTLVIEENDCNFEILFLAVDGYFEMVFEKKVLTEDFFFKICFTKFVLSDNQIKPV